MNLTPEQKARVLIDAALAEAGWLVQNRDEMNLAAGRGVAVREFKMASGHGFADYLLFVDDKAVGALEAKPVGYPLLNVELQVDKYAHGLPAGLNPPVDPLPFQYISTGIETRRPDRSQSISCAGRAWSLAQKPLDERFRAAAALLSRRTPL